MTKLEFYTLLCDPKVACALGGKSFPGYVQKHYPKIYSRICTDLGKKSFTKEELYCYLKEVNRPICWHPKCTNHVKLGRFDSDFYPFCKGMRCHLPIDVVKGAKQPKYARQLIHQIRELKSTSQSSGGFTGWLFGRIDNAIFIDLISNLGYKFTPKNLYTYLFPNSRTTCTSPGCKKPVHFSLQKLKYIKYCSSSCGVKDPATMEKRKQNYLEKTDGKYTSHTQTPEFRKAHSEFMKSDEYKRLEFIREFIRSDGLYTDPRQRPEKVAKTVAAHRERELIDSGGTRTNSSQRPEVRQKISKTVKSEDCQTRTMITVFRKTQGQYTIAARIPEVIEKRVYSHRENELVRSNGKRTNSSQRKSVRKKISGTLGTQDYQEAKANREFLRSGGTGTNVMHRPGMIEKQQKSAKTRYTVSYAGHTWEVQGYEDVAIRRLVDSFEVPAKAIKTTKKAFPYNKPLLGSKRTKYARYLPDFILLGTRKWYIEVKSKRTANSWGDVDKDGLGPIENAKARAMVNAGKSYILMVFHRVKGKKTGEPRSGKLAYFILATPKNPNFELRNDFSTFRKFFKRKLDNWI